PGALREREREVGEARRAQGDRAEEVEAEEPGVVVRGPLLPEGLHAAGLALQQTHPKRGRRVRQVPGVRGGDGDREYRAVAGDRARDAEPRAAGAAPLGPAVAAGDEVA